MSRWRGAASLKTVRVSKIGLILRIKGYLDRNRPIKFRQRLKQRVKLRNYLPIPNPQVPAVLDVTAGIWGSQVRIPKDPQAKFCWDR